MRVLLTGMSGTGKSALVHELRRRGYLAYDADDDGFSEPRAHGRWGWRADRVADLLAQDTQRLLFFAGCSEEQIELPFDYRVLLTAPKSVLVDRLRTTGNAYGRGGVELSQVLSDLAEVEPLLRRSADLVLTTTAPLPDVADRLITRIAEFGAARSRGRPRALLEGRSRTYPRFRRACLGGVAAGANCRWYCGERCQPRRSSVVDLFGLRPNKSTVDSRTGPHQGSLSTCFPWREGTRQSTRR
jgi:broad-specificity NMP kinase